MDIVRPLDFRPRADRLLNGGRQGNRRPSRQTRPLGKWQDSGAGAAKTKVLCEKRNPSAVQNVRVPRSGAPQTRRTRRHRPAGLAASQSHSWNRSPQRPDLTNQSAIAEPRQEVVGDQAIRRAKKPESEPRPIFDFKSGGAQFGEPGFHHFRPERPTWFARSRAREMHRGLPQRPKNLRIETARRHLQRKAYGVIRSAIPGRNPPRARNGSTRRPR
jgi:hypothetical protein